MKTEIITESQAIYNEPLLSLFCGGEKKHMDYATESGDIPDLWTDPDYLRMPEYDGRIPFVRSRLNEINYVIVPDHIINDGFSYNTDNIDSKKLIRMLTRFFEDDPDNSFAAGKGTTWSYFDDRNNGIAFRDGKGYIYSIWDYTAK